MTIENTHSKTSQHFPNEHNFTWFCGTCGFKPITRNYMKLHTNKTHSSKKPNKNFNENLQYAWLKKHQKHYPKHFFMKELKFISGQQSAKLFFFPKSLPYARSRPQKPCHIDLSLPEEWDFFGTKLKLCPTKMPLNQVNTQKTTIWVGCVIKN